MPKKVPNDSGIEVSQDKVIETIKGLRNRKSAGEDKIPNELIKYGGPKLWDQISILVKEIFKKTTIPEEWKTNIVIAIFKRGEKRDPGNYSGINLLNTHLKLTTKIISKKISEMVTLHDEPQGFRKGRCVDAIFAIRQLCEKSFELNKPAFFCFIDIKKAFDNVSLKHVMNVLMKHKIPSNLIHDMYTNNCARIKVEGKLTKAVPVTRRLSESITFQYHNQ